MDTITHGIAGALLAKAAFGGDDLLTARPMSRARVVTLALMLGAIFPDADVVREFFSRNDLLVITWHRSITHSLLCLPVFALALAALTQWFARWRKWESPSFGALTAIYAIGILSHILLDLATTFGTMIWSPLEWSRPAWDILFIIDFTFSAILLLPQILAWIYASKNGLRRKAMSGWLLCSVATMGIALLSRNVGAPISDTAVFVTIAVLATLFLLPAIKAKGLQIPYVAWQRAGLATALVYAGLAVYLHHAALERVKDFAAKHQANVQALGALPLPPSLWHWDGLIRTPDGVYEFRLDLSARSGSTSSAGTEAADSYLYNYSLFPDAPANPYIEEAKHLPDVQKFLWFARFPVTRFRPNNSGGTVEILDMRFPALRPGQQSAFVYRVQFDGNGNVLSQGRERERD